ncbi:aspartate kinase [Candidatus Chlorohelix sp.]|uniref:aspartate kinase n=1 Tax=Candidatus Chlorohelix sp. TaxID=3139201 RepID=UPI0030720E6B
MIVMKFGGTSVGSAERLRHVAKLVGGYLELKPVVVVSAMAGTTDWLLNTARQLAESNPSVGTSADKLIAEFHSRYHQVVDETIDNPDIRSSLRSEIATLLHQLLRLFTGIELLGEVSLRSLDAVAAFGEKLSSTILAAALRDIGYKSEAISATTLIETDRTFTSAVPQMEQTTLKCREKLIPLVAQGSIPVVTGFIGATSDGITTTLGRGGSDYSASIIGAALDSEEIWIWTDVDGVMSADPRLVSNARSLRRISYAEAGELSYFGAKVIHPLTVMPAVEKNIPLYIKNTMNPEFPGTRIDNPKESAEGVVKAVTSARNLALITVSGGGVLTVPGIAARTFARVHDHNANVLMISHASSGHDLCFVLEKQVAPSVVASLNREFDREIHRKEIDPISLDDNIVIVAVVGAGMRGTPGVAGRLFSTLGRKNINIIAIAQGSSELNISLITSVSDEKAAVHAIHDEFISLTGLGKSMRYQPAK